MRNKESRSNIAGDQLGMASVSYAAPHNDAALILLNLLRQLNSCTAAHVSAARGDRAKTIAPVASCQHLEQDVCHVVWDKVFPTSKHETIIWRLLAEDDGGFETEMFLLSETRNPLLQLRVHGIQIALQRWLFKG